MLVTSSKSKAFYQAASAVPLPLGEFVSGVRDTSVAASCACGFSSTISVHYHTKSDRGYFVPLP